MNNLTMSNLTNVNPLLFTLPEGGGSSSNNHGRRMGTLQDYCGDESPSNILLTNQSASTPIQRHTSQLAPKHNFKNVMSQHHQSTKQLNSKQRNSDSNSNEICAPMLLKSSEAPCQNITNSGGNLTEPSLPSGLQKTLDMDQLIRSFLREQNENVMLNSISQKGSSTIQSETAIPISSIIDAYHNNSANNGIQNVNQNQVQDSVPQPGNEGQWTANIDKLHRIC